MGVGTGVGLSSRPPKILEPLLAQFGVAGGVLDGPMAEPILNGASIVPLVGQRVPASVPHHVGVNFEGEAGALANAFDQPINSKRSSPPRIALTS